MLLTNRLTVAIDFRSMNKKNTMDVRLYHLTLWPSAFIVPSIFK